jgi:hypothetical protein
MQELVNSVRERLAVIGPEVAADLVILKAGELDRLSPIAPAVAVYFSGDHSSDRAEVEALVEKAVPVLPVVDALEGYTANTPDVLHSINAIAVTTETGLPALANLVLENLSLLRRSRRLFLSYRRADSTAAAHQLRVAFDDEGYDPFLDTSSVPKGDDFQAVLMHRLLDSDVMIVLDTKNFLSSRWTREELAAASAMGVGLLRVVWPGVARVPYAELAEHLYLDPRDFVDELLTVKAIARIIDAVEALRARCIAARHTNLVVEFCDEAKRIGAVTSIQPGRYVLAILPDGRRIAAIPAVGVPDANLYHDASGRFPSEGEHADEAVLVYNDSGMLDTWKAFLNWLDEHLPVRGLRVTDTVTRLGDGR